MNLSRAAFESLEVSSIRCPAVPGELGHILDHICATDQHQCNLAERSRPARVSRESSQVDLQNPVTGWPDYISNNSLKSRGSSRIQSTFTETNHNPFELAKIFISQVTVFIYDCLNMITYSIRLVKQLQSEP